MFGKKKAGDPHAIDYSRKDRKRNLCLPAKDLPVRPTFSPSHEADWRDSHHWRIFRIMSEFTDAFQFLGDFKNTVTFFGSARLQPGDPWYEEARQLGALVAQAGFAVITGGGPGVMEAVNRGADDVEGESIGINIKLPYEQRINEYVRKSIGFHYFFVRKVALAYSAQAYVFFPGGYGTLDEFFELITLIQTHKIVDRIPLILIGKQFWSHLDAFIKNVLMDQYKTIDHEDAGLYKIVDSAEEAMEIIKESKPRTEF